MKCKVSDSRSGYSQRGNPPVPLSYVESTARPAALSIGGAATAWELDAERPYLLALARRLSFNAHDANDLVQDAIVRALPALGKVAAGTHLRAWLLTILRRMHIDRLRRVAREPEAVPIDDVRETLVSDAPVFDDREDFGPEDIRAALRALPKPFRKVLELHDLEGRSYREIARALRIPRATVGTRLRRARLKLRTVLLDRQPIGSQHRLAAPAHR